MAPGRCGADHDAMDRTTPRTRIVLVPDDRVGTGPYADKIRRYRLARLRLLERRDAVALRRPELGPVHD
jgi:hypothetical protein